ncbi:hypothetical protein [Bradyrhizobium sp. HKCCYLS20291]|uniref:hypothetical protein n=1 Tax=Bradyrhizobium sp. HKCCYLS20291 TaxID=3420766 RepID=UPI003EBF53F1
MTTIHLPPGRGLTTAFASVGDILQQGIWDGDPIKDEHLPSPKRVTKTHMYLIMVGGARDWRAGTQFEIVR